MARPPGARHVALDVLGRILGGGQPFDETFAGHPALTDLARRDRAFVRLLVTTVLRRRGQIDALLDELLRRPLDDVRARNILRLGAAQLLFLGTPPHAAVGETVALATGRQAFARGLANAVLRRLASEGPARLAAQDASRLTVPEWLWSSWCEAYGEKQTRAIAWAHLDEPPIDLTVAGDLTDLARELDATPIHGQTLRRRAGGLIEDLPGYTEGRWWVQDLAAALPARLLGDVAGHPVLDLCAAPGGKTAQLASAGARVVAIEASKSRAARFEANLARLRLEAQLVIADACQWRPETPFGHVLLDAPCTATGTIRRHPDITWHKTPEDVARMAALQGRLLEAAVHMLRPGGLLVYASCSLQPEEGEQVIERALNRGLPVARVPITPVDLDHLPVDYGAAGDVRTLPCHLPGKGGLDGFFIARLRRQV